LEYLGVFTLKEWDNYYVADSLIVGSKSYQLTVVAWLATTSAMIVLLSMFGLNPAAAANFLTPSHSKVLSSANYANTYWSISEVRTTQAKDRVCADELVGCKPVIVVEVLITNVYKNSVNLNVNDLTLKFPSGVNHPAKRFDCPSPTNVVGLEAKFGIINSDCPFSTSFITVNPGKTRALSVLFIPDTYTLPNLDSISLAIQEISRATALPAHIPLEGDSLESPYPVSGKFNLDADSNIIAVELLNNNSTKIKTESVSIDVNHRNTRVNEYSEFAIVKLRLLEPVVRNSEIIQKDFWSLELEKQIVIADWVELDASKNEVTIQFSFPEDSKEFNIIGGSSEELSFEIPVEIPEL